MSRSPVPAGRARRCGLRLVAGFAAAMLVLLTAAGAFVYWRVEYALDRGLDTELRGRRPRHRPAGGRRRDRRLARRGRRDRHRSGRWSTRRDGPRPWGLGPGADGVRALVGGRTSGRAPASRTVDVGSILPVADAPYRVRVTAARAAAGTRPYLLVGVRRDHRDEALRELLLQMSLAGLGALVGGLPRRRPARPAGACGRSSATGAGPPRSPPGPGDRRLEVPPGRDDEVTRLGHTLNEMLDALEEVAGPRAPVRRRRQPRAAHPADPAARRIQLARRRPRRVAEHEAVLDELAVDVARLADLADQLLDLDRGLRSTPASATPTSVVAGLGSSAGGPPAPTTPTSVVLEQPAGRGRRRPCAAPRPGADGHQPARPTRCVHGGGTGAARVHDATARTPSCRSSTPGPACRPTCSPRRPTASAAHPRRAARPGAGLGLALVEQVVTAAGGELRLCHAGRTTPWASPSGAGVRARDRMTVTVLLPVVSAPRSGPSGSRTSAPPPAGPTPR